LALMNLQADDALVIVGVADLHQFGYRLAVTRLSLALRVRPLVPVELEPAQRVEDLLDVLGCRALAVGVLDPQHELALLPPREEPVVQRRARATDVQLACWRGREADFHAPSMLRMERMNSSF